jgi:hypothetical protein
MMIADAKSACAKMITLTMAAGSLAAVAARFEALLAS